MNLPDDCYYHGITSKSVIPTNLEQRLELSYTVLRQIIESGAILSRRNQGIKRYRYYNSDKQICLCKDMRNDSYEYLGNGEVLSGYIEFVQKNFSIIINNYIRAKQPLIMSDEDILSQWYDSCWKIRPGRYSNMYDEYRTKHNINANKFVGVGVPFFYSYYSYYEDMKNKELQDLFQYYYCQIISLLMNCNIDIPIYDTETKEEIKCVDAEYFQTIQKRFLDIKRGGR